MFSGVNGETSNDTLSWNSIEGSLEYGRTVTDEGYVFTDVRHWDTVGFCRNNLMGNTWKKDRSDSEESSEMRNN